MITAADLLGLRNMDENGNVASITYPGNKTVSYTYDDLNRLETVTIGWLGSNNTATYHYDASSRLYKIDQFNGSSANYGYDNANRLIYLQNETSSHTPINYYSFKLDGNGNRIFIDKDEPLTPTPSIQSTDYTYSTYGNKLLSAGADSFDYDDEGQISIKNSVLSYLFDDQHRLKTIVGTAEFSYDGQGNRLLAVRSGVTTRYIYDAAGNLIAEAVEGAGTYEISRYYIYGAGLLAMVTASGDLYCYHFNAVGSTIAMTDTGQNIVQSYAYTPFGTILSESGTIDQPFRFVGEHGVMTEPDGLYYMRARYYDPFVGRFISEDPIGFGGGDVNLYAYVQNNPVMLVDPSGLKWLAGRNDPPVMGSINARPGFQPGDPGMAFFERYVPNFYETSVQHDALLYKIGIENINKNMLTMIVNFSTMPIAFSSAIVTNIYQTFTGTEEAIFGLSSSHNTNPGRINSTYSGSY